jgi:hypothetical protein
VAGAVHGVAAGGGEGIGGEIGSSCLTQRRRGAETQRRQSEWVCCQRFRPRGNLFGVVARGAKVASAADYWLCNAASATQWSE